MSTEEIQEHNPFNMVVWIAFLFLAIELFMMFDAIATRKVTDNRRDRIEGYNVPL